jgi:hypothetical protein
VSTRKEKSFPPINPVLPLVNKSPGRTYLNTGCAETASGFPKVLAHRSDNDPTFLIENEINRSYPANFLANPDTTRATNAEIIISLK